MLNLLAVSWSLGRINKASRMVEITLTVIEDLAGGQRRQQSAST